MNTYKTIHIYSTHIFIDVFVCIYSSVGRIANTRRMRNVQKLIKIQMHSETTLMTTSASASTSTAATAAAETSTTAGRLRSSWMLNSLRVDESFRLTIF